MSKWQPPYWAASPDGFATRRTRDIADLRKLAEGLPVVVHDEPLDGGGQVYRVRDKRRPTEVLMNGRYHVIAAYLKGWTDARRQAETPVAHAGDVPPG